MVRARYWDPQTHMRDVLCVPPCVTSPREAVVDLPGVVDQDQAWREGIYMAAANLRRRRILSFTMLAQGRALRWGDLIRVAHPRPAYGRGTLIGAAVWPHLVLTAPHGIDPEGERQQWLTLTRPDGSASRATCSELHSGCDPRSRGRHGALLTKQDSKGSYKKYHIDYLAGGAQERPKSADAGVCVK